MEKKKIESKISKMDVNSKKEPKRTIDDYIKVWRGKYKKDDFVDISPVGREEL